MKIFNKVVWSSKEPLNKNDIWFDGSHFRIYSEGDWIVVTSSKGDIYTNYDMNSDFNNDF